MLLHTLNAAPDTAASRDCLQLLAPDDILLLLGDGVYHAIGGTAACLAIENTGAELWALQQDVAAAGISERLGKVTLCDMAGFVELSERCDQQMAWY